jgi:hypothetical protein
MENKKYGWSTRRNTFERYYYNQLNRFKNATWLFSDDELTENSSLEEISTRFDELIDLLKITKINRDIKHSVIPKGLCSDSYKYSTLEGFKNMLEKELEEFFTTDIQNLPDKYRASKNNRILVIDINYLPSEYKGDNVDTIRESLEAIYGCKVLLIDGSRKNLEGTQINNPPVYFI